jgi:putative glutamine amidotransferase
MKARLTDKFLGKKARPPIIGISGAGDKLMSASLAAMVVQITNAGGEVRFIGDQAERIGKSGGVENAVARDLSGLDGFIVMGNNEDIDPAKYGQTKEFEETSIETNKARASYEEAAIQYALDNRIPLLGICGGMQRLNVLDHKTHGGTLHQHLPAILTDASGKPDERHCQDITKVHPFVPVQPIRILPNTRLSDIAGNKDYYFVSGRRELAPGVYGENSYHHQAIDKVRDDFRVCAISADDYIIEAIEPRAGSQYSNQYVLGVQFHPEFGTSALGEKIVQGLTDAARAFAKNTGRRQDGLAQDAPSGNASSASWKDQLKRQRDKMMMR